MRFFKENQHWLTLKLSGTIVRRGDDMQELRKFLSPEMVFGDNARLLLGQYILHFGVEKVLLVTDKTIQSFDWFKDIINTLNEQEIQYIIFDDVTINPKDTEVASGTAVYLENNCDLLVAIGGGSVIDCAKGIGVLAYNKGTISDYEGVDQISFPIPPLICVPTTAGSAADVSQFAIITNTINHYKMALASKTLVPDLALVDPIVTLTCGFDLTVDTGLDALVHAIEAYVSNASSFMTNTHALAAMDNIFKYLPALSKDLPNLNLRRKVMEACLNAGLAFSNASLGLAHAMAHAIGGRMDLIHGEVNALLLEHIIEFNYDHATAKYDEIQRLMGETYATNDTLAPAIKTFIAGIRQNTKVNASSLENVEELANYVLKDPCIVTNPKTATLRDVVNIYEKIFR